MSDEPESPPPTACNCPGPGYCPGRGRMVSRIGQRICKAGDPTAIARYFDRASLRGDGPRPRTRPGGASRRSSPGTPAPSCVYFGDPVIDPATGTQATTLCKTCRGNVRLKVFGCGHPGHAAGPTTTVRGCNKCRDFTAPGPTTIEATRTMTATALPPDIPPTMVPPGRERPRIFEPYRGVLQIMVTRSCDESCYGCTAGSNLVHKPSVMTPDQFEAAVRSLGFGEGSRAEDRYFGIVGVFGGNPCTSRYFEDYCRILRSLVPFEQRGIWTNNPMGKGTLCRITFDPKHSNINVHTRSDAYEEFRRDWPEAIEARKAHVDEGLRADAVHGSPWVAMRDLDRLPFPDGSSRENTEANRLELIGRCTINQNWSAIITLVRGELRGFFCEIAGHMAALHADNPDWAGSGRPMPDIGLEIAPGWWKRPMADFADQVRTCCHNCAVPMNRPGQLAIGGEREEFSETHRFIARPKKKDREVAFISSESLGKRDRPATEYLSGVTPGYKGA